ncbi:hypothetical protein ACHAXA_006271 [Cyclostephanos tholiformis]|uniref:STI1 domain-containing protein n=1 Tax=Cyclostephanos tholiformis TaxID=382380 RepID=A0ABD3SPU9_9STRA
MTSEKLCDRLKSLILEPCVEHSLPSLRPLIQVVRSEEYAAKGPGGVSFDSKSPDDDGDDDGDDGPPPIIFQTKPIARQKPFSPSRCDGQCTSETPSLAEQLLAEATLAKGKQQRLQEQKDRQRAKKSNFGLKKGFLNSLSSKKDNSKMKIDAGKDQSNSKLLSDKYQRDAAVEEQKGERQKNLIYELDSNGNIIPLPCNRQSPSHNINNQLHLPEVQSSIISHLQSNSAQWATSDLVDTIIKSHPKLARGMYDPRYTAALQNMQTNPKETMELLKETSPDIVEWLMEFCSVIGDHFLQMGEVRDGKECRVNEGERWEGAKVREMGPLEKKALERHQQMQAKDNESNRDFRNASPSNEMDNQVASILASEELRSILMDPVIQEIMEECSTGNKLRHYMTHEEFGPKLRMLMEAGLIRLA